MDIDPFDRWYEKELATQVHVKSDWDFLTISHDTDSSANVQEKRINVEKIDDWIIGLVCS